jgi:uncharacterized membrane protein
MASDRGFSVTTLHHQVWIDAPAAKVYGALATAEGLGQMMAWCWRTVQVQHMAMCR